MQIELFEQALIELDNDDDLGQSGCWRFSVEDEDLHVLGTLLPKE